MTYKLNNTSLDHLINILNTRYSQSTDLSEVRQINEVFTELDKLIEIAELREEIGAA